MTPRCIVLLALGAAACDAGPPAWCTAEGADSVIMVGSPTAWVQPPELVAVWRVGSGDGEELLLPASAAIDAQSGLIAVVDFGSGDVSVVSTDGRWVGRWGRRGDGPNELRVALAASWQRDGLLAVYDPANSKLVHFDSTGEAIRESPVDRQFTAALGGGVSWLRLTPDGAFLAKPVRHGPVTRGMLEHLVLRASPGRPPDTVVSALVPVVEVEGSTPITLREWGEPTAALSSEGVLAVAGTPYYRIDLASGGRVTRICRDVQRSRPGASGVIDREDVPPDVADRLRRAPRPDFVASIGRLDFDHDDRLWVQRDLPATLSMEDAAIGREAARFDLYDQAGAFLGEVVMPTRTRFLAAAGDLIVGLERDDMDVLTLIGLRFAPR